MANDLNQCNFIGRLGDAPEIRFMPSGDPVANMRLAVGKVWKDRQSGNKQEATNWLTLVAFGRTAEVCQQYLGKGARIQATCEVRVRQWQAQDGSKRYATEFVVQRMQMLDTKQDSRQAAQQQGSDRGHTSPQGYGEQGQQQGQAEPSPYAGNPRGQQSNYGAPDPGSFDDFDDEIPFMRKAGWEGG